MTESIRPYIPFTLIHFEAFETEQEAIAREKYFKTSAGRRFLKKKMAHSTMPARLNAVRTGIV